MTFDEAKRQTEAMKRARTSDMRSRIDKADMEMRTVQETNKHVLEKQIEDTMVGKS